MPDLGFINKELIDSIRVLISQNGPWLAFLIFISGLAWKLEPILNIIRLFFKDRDTHKRKTKELDYRIQRDAHAIGIEIDKKKKIGETKSKRDMKR